MKIAWLITDQGGCSYFRAQLPAYCLQEMGWDITAYVLQPNVPMCSAWFVDFDAVIGQRLSHRGTAKLLSTIPVDRRPALIYECDDLITDLDPSNPAYADYASHHNRILAVISECDGIIVSTPELSRQLGKRVADASHGIWPPCRVVDNYLDFGLRRWGAREPRQTGHFTIGWQGAVSHVDDWRPVASALTEVLALRRGVAFACCSTPEMVSAWRQEMPEVADEQFVFIPPTDFRQFPSRLSHFDIGIAPLVDTPFNRCRSDLKLLEYGAYGIPWVASDLPPYNRHSIGGFLAEDRHEWVQALLNMIDEHEEREAFSAAWRGYVYQRRGLADCGPAWAAAIASLVANFRSTLV